MTPYVYFLILWQFLFSLMLFCAEVRSQACTKTLYSETALNASLAMASNHLRINDGASFRAGLGDRLAVIILFSQGFGHHERLRLLRCCLRKLTTNLPATPKDVYVWVPEDSVSNAPTWLSENPRTFVLGMHPSSWAFPCDLDEDTKWVARRNFNLDYYKIGRWRMVYSMEFVKQMGYKYMLQIDDDAILNGMVEGNVLEDFKIKNFDMGVFSDSIGEVSHIALGLPELTKFWLALRKFTPVGTLLEHVKGKSLEAFSSETWDRMYHPAYFLILKVDFWFSPPVQDYLMAIYRSGRDIESRWLEQMVQNMIRLVFVPKDKLWVMAQVDVGHDRHRKGNFQAWCGALNTTV